MNAMNEIVRGALSAAHIALSRLDAAGVAVLGMSLRGGRAVLTLDEPPAFVAGGIRIRVTTGCRRETVYAAPFHGVQIEWRERSGAMGGA